MIIQHLLEPFHYEFMWRAIWIAGLIGVVCALLSCFVILKGWSLLGDALSHAVVPGVVIANLFNWPFAIGAFIAGLLAVLGIGLVRQLAALKGDAAIGLIFTAFFAVGLVLISKYPTMLSMSTILFGNLLGIADRDITQLILISIFCLSVLLLRWKDFMLYCFDEKQARMMGLNVSFLYFLLLILLSLVAVSALQTVGAILVIAMLITPGATAYLLTIRLSQMLWIAPLIGGTSSLLGAYLSYFLNTSVGGLIVLMQTACFLIAFVYSYLKKHALNGLNKVEK